MWTRKLVIFLVRKKLGLKNYERFRFANQKAFGTYYFVPDKLMKNDGVRVRKSSVSLNWLLDDKCEIVKL